MISWNGPGPIDWNQLDSNYANTPKDSTGAPLWSWAATTSGAGPERPPVSPSMKTGNPNQPPAPPGYMGIPWGERGTGGYMPKPTEDWKFGNGQGYRPGRDPMMDRRMWQPRPTSFRNMLQQRTPARSSLDSMGVPSAGQFMRGNPQAQGFMSKFQAAQNPANPMYASGAQQPFKPRVMEPNVPQWAEGQAPQPVYGNDFGSWLTNNGRMASF